MKQPLPAIRITFFQWDRRQYRIAMMDNREPLAIAFRREELAGSDNEVRRIRERVNGKSGVYVLTGAGVHSPVSVYVGEGTDVWKRLKEHRSDERKNFWCETFVLLKEDRQFDESEIKFLESVLTKKVKNLQNTRRWSLENRQQPSETARKVQWDKKPSLEQLLEDAILCFDTLGSKLFRDLYSFENQDSDETDLPDDETPEEIGNPEPDSKPRVLPNQVVFKAEGKNYLASMTLESDNTIKLHKGSEISSLVGSTLRRVWEKIIKLREDLVRSNNLVAKGDRLHLKVDVCFDSSSAAASFVSGSSRSGPVFWKIFDEDSNEYITLKDYQSKAEVSSHSLVFKFGSDKFDASMMVKSDKQFIVLKDSLASLDLSPKAPEDLMNQRQDLIRKKVLVRKGSKLVFSQNCEFRSPSAAASAVAGYRPNGKTCWKLADGTTLRDWKKSV